LILKDKIDLKNYIESLSRKDSIGVISGSFDALHDGHKLALDHCSSKVDKLIVLINSDESIRLYKGNERPFIKLDKRIKTLNAYNNKLIIVSFNELIPNNMLEIIKPDIYFLSKEWIQNPIEKIVLEKYNTKIQEHPQLANTSTTIQNPEIDNSKGAIFFDRDGTINKDVGYLNNVNDIHIPKENLETISKLSELNLFNIIVSNQSGVGLGYFDTKMVKKINDEISRTINKNNGRIDKIYFDTSTNENSSKDRKPNIGMILKARKDFNISLRKSWVIGDKYSDIELGKKCNMRTIYIKNNKYDYKSNVKPDFTINKLPESLKIIKNL
tara:strand:- start:2300 stop:3280 length:981 start_codon:yes stop_codon:yes gene_type:complete